MALIDLAVRSNLFFHSTRAFALAFGTIGASRTAQRHSNQRLEATVNQTAATCLASLTLEALPQAAFQGTLISAALPWAPALFCTAAVATAYLAPDKAHLPLQAIEATTLALCAFAALTAPSAVTLGTFGILTATWIQMQEIPHVSETIKEVMKIAGGALASVALLWALKQSILSFTLQYALYALTLGALSLYVAVKKAEKSEQTQETAQGDEQTRGYIVARYFNKLPDAFEATFRKRVLTPYTKRAGGAMANNIELRGEILHKWRDKCQDRDKKDYLTDKFNIEEDLPQRPKFKSLTEEWVYGTYAHSLDDPKSLVGHLFSIFGSKHSMDNLLCAVHKKTASSVIREYFSNKEMENLPEEDKLSFLNSNPYIIDYIEEAGSDFGLTGQNVRRGA